MATRLSLSFGTSAAEEILERRRVLVRLGVRSAEVLQQLLVRGHVQRRLDSLHDARFDAGLDALLQTPEKPSA